MKNKGLILTIVILAVLIGLAVFLAKTPGKPGKLDEFAQCLGDKGAIFYGTFWCPNCNDQKAMFGRSAKLLPYVECSTPDSKGQTSECREKGIEAYPTWEFEEGEITQGVTSLEVLAERTGCVLPESN